MNMNDRIALVIGRLVLQQENLAAEFDKVSAEVKSLREAAEKPANEPATGQ
jgi:hypothetical protein